MTQDSPLLDQERRDAAQDSPLGEIRKSEKSSRLRVELAVVMMYSEGRISELIKIGCVIWNRHCCTDRVCETGTSSRPLYGQQFATSTQQSMKQTAVFRSNSALCNMMLQLMSDADTSKGSDLHADHTSLPGTKRCPVRQHGVHLRAEHPEDT